MHSDFHWEHFVDGPALYLGKRVVATLTPLRNGCRIRFFTGRHVFRPNEDLARRAAETWATRWEAEIRGTAAPTLGGWMGQGMPGVRKTSPAGAATSD